MGFEQRAIIQVGKRIAVQYDEIVGEIGHHRERASSAKRLILDDIVDAQSEALALAEECLEQRRHVTKADADALKAVMAQLM